MKFYYQINCCWWDGTDMIYYKINIDDSVGDGIFVVSGHNSQLAVDNFLNWGRYVSNPIEASCNSDTIPIVIGLVEELYSKKEVSTYTIAKNER